MTEEAARLAAEIRTEADLASRAGQHDRLNRIADDVAVLGGVPGEKVTVDRGALVAWATRIAHALEDDPPRLNVVWGVVDDLMDASRAGLGGDGGTRPKGTQGATDGG